ncbi:hypothetical protein D3C76_1231670 [compost metagenome]
MAVLGTDAHLNPGTGGRGDHLRQGWRLFQQIQNALHLVDIAELRLRQHVRRPAQEEALPLRASVERLIQHLHQLFEMLDMPLHLPANFVVQGRLQLVYRHAREPAVQQVDHLLHIRNGQAGRNGHRLILHLPRIRNDDGHRRRFVQRQ